MYDIASIYSARSVDDAIRALQADPAAVVIAGGAFASLGCLVIVLIGPYYLTKVLPYDLITALFYIASACTGLGTAVVGLKCGQLYGAIAPRKAILYTALSHVAADTKIHVS